MQQAWGARAALQPRGARSWERHSPCTVTSWGQARHAVPHARARAAQDVGDAGDAYAALLGAAVLPRAAGALTNAWEPRDPEPALRWLDAWEGLLPPAVQRHVLHSLVFPKARARPRRRLRRRRSGSTCCPALWIALCWFHPSCTHIGA